MNGGDIHVRACGAIFRLQPNKYDKAAFGKVIYDLKNLELERPIEEISFSDEIHRLAIRHGIDGITARISVNQRFERQWLNQSGFYFVETVLHPWIDLSIFGNTGNDVEVREANENDIPAIAKIAFEAFGNERYHQDENYDDTMANRRYEAWVTASIKAKAQQKTIALTKDQAVIGFCVYELLEGGSLCYWHLNAMDPKAQGKGLGKLGWEAMLSFHRKQKAERVKTTISSANTRALSLYSRLGFRFENTETTFHWVRSKGNIRAYT